MQAVADQLDSRAGVVCRTDDRWLAVVERIHAVEQVGRVGSAGVVGFHRGVVVGDCVAKRDRAGLGDLADEVHRARFLTGDGHETDLSAGLLVETPEHLNVRCVQVFRRLSTALVIAQERTFEMDAGAACALALEIADCMHRRSQGFFLERHCGRTPGGDAVAGVVGGHDLEPLDTAVAGILLHRAVGVDVDQTRDDILVGRVDVRGLVNLTDCADGFVKFHIADSKGTVRLKNHTIFENHAVTSGRLAAAMD